MIIYALLQVVDNLLTFYEWLVFIYCILSWFPFKEGGFMSDVQHVISSIVEPYLNLFRRIIPPFMGIDFSPTVAIIVLFTVERIVFGLLL